MTRWFSEALNQFAARLPVRPAAYFWSFAAWLVLLWCLSASSPPAGPEIRIPHFDKILHFAYFSAGGALLAASCGLKWNQLSRRGLLLIVVGLCSLIGRLDEYHQGFTPGRSGNDTGDWLADTVGGLFGGWFLIRYLLSGIAQKKGDSALHGSSKTS